MKLFSRHSVARRAIFRLENCVVLRHEIANLKIYLLAHLTNKDTHCDNVFWSFDSMLLQINSWISERISARTFDFETSSVHHHMYLWSPINTIQFHIPLADRFALTHTFHSLQHFESLVARHFHERERVILDACDAYISGAVVGSSSAKGTKHPRDNNRSFADFKKSLEKYSELLRKDLAANRTHFLKLTRDSPAAADEIVECTSS